MSKKVSGGRVRSVSSYVCVVWGQGVCQCIPLTPLYTYYSGGFVWFCHLEVTVTGPTCDALTTNEYSAVNGVAMRSTNCHSCIPLDGLRQRGQLVVPLILQRLRACRCRFD